MLILNIKSEWETLCTFLQVPVPDIPYPKIVEECIENDSSSIPTQTKLTRFRNFTAPILLLIFVAYGINRKRRNWYLNGGILPCKKCTLFTIRNIFTTVANQALYNVLNIPFHLGIL